MISIAEVSLLQAIAAIIATCELPRCNCLSKHRMNLESALFVLGQGIVTETEAYSKIRLGTSTEKHCLQCCSFLWYNFYSFHSALAQAGKRN